MKQSQVAIFRGAGIPLELSQVSVPDLGPGEALVRVDCCTVCGSDLHSYHGKRKTPVPSILGHEIIGTIEATVGAVDVEGKPLQIGDRVTWSVCVSCGDCVRCVAGIPQKCLSLKKYGHEELTQDQGLVGGMAEHVYLQRGSSVVRLPKQIPDAVLCPANCATATVAAAVRTAGELRGRRVLIFGAGMLGITACAFAKVHEAAEICICEPNHARLEPLHDFGADRVTDQAPKDRFDVVFEMSGNPNAVASALACADIGGQAVLVGSVFPSPSVELDPEQIVRSLVSIHGIHNYRPDDLKTAVEFLCEYGTVFPFAGLVAKTFSLEEANEAVAFATERKPIRVAISG